MDPQNIFSTSAHYFTSLVAPRVLQDREIRKKLRSSEFRKLWKAAAKAFGKHQPIQDPKLQNFVNNVSAAIDLIEQRDAKDKTFEAFKYDSENKTRNAAEEVRMEYDEHRNKIEREYLREREGLHFWNVVKLAKLKIRHTVEVIAFHLDSIVHPAFLKTFTREEGYKEELAEEQKDYKEFQRQKRNDIKQVLTLALA